MNETSEYFFAAEGWVLGLWAILGVVVLVALVLGLNFLSAWIKAHFSGAPVNFTELIALRLRSVPVGQVVDARITAVKSGLPTSIDDLSTHFLAGGSRRRGCASAWRWSRPHRAQPR